jgi:hypothetical protein
VKAFYPLTLQPAVGATFAHKAQKRLDTQRAHLVCDPFSGQCQGIEQVRQAHQIMITLHGIPVVREGVLIAVTLPFFDLHAHFDAPTLARAQVAALMDRVVAQTLAGQPYMLGLLVDQLAGGRIDFLPGFFTADSMHQEAFAVPLLARGDVVDPPELLLTPAPVLVFAVVGQARLERFDLLPHRGQTLSGQDNHKLPLVLTS